MKKFSSTMKANSRRISPNKRVRTALFFGVIVLVVVFFLPRLFGVISAIVMTPIHHIETWFLESPSSLPYYLRDRSALITELNQLKASLPSEQGIKVTMHRLQTENDSLRSLLSATEEPRIAAGVIGRPNQVPYDVLVIDRGSEEGIVTGAPVYAGVDTVIGSITTVYQHSAIVSLVTTPGYRSTVYIFGPNIYTTAEGQGGGVLRVGVPQGVALEEGNLVMLPALEAGVFGEISVIKSEPTLPEQFGFVTSSVPLSSLRLVAVGQTSLQPVSFEEARAAVQAIQADRFNVPVPEGVLIEINSTSTATSTDVLTSTTSSPAL